MFGSIVEFATRGDMKNVITKLDDTEINGRRIRIIEQKSRRRHRYEDDLSSDCSLCDVPLNAVMCRLTRIFVDSFECKNKCLPSSQKYKFAITVEGILLKYYIQNVDVCYFCCNSRFSELAQNYSFI